MADNVNYRSYMGGFMKAFRLIKEFLMRNRCHCGMPLHYSDPRIERYLREIILKQGRYVAVTNIENNKSYWVDRHYIALHGLTCKDIEYLGFKEIKK